MTESTPPTPRPSDPAQKYDHQCSSVSQARQEHYHIPGGRSEAEEYKSFPPVPVGEPGEEYRAECAANVAYEDDDTNDWRLFANAHSIKVTKFGIIDIMP